MEYPLKRIMRKFRMETKGHERKKEYMKGREIEENANIYRANNRKKCTNQN
jgi:hypothetical protein